MRRARQRLQGVEEVCDVVDNVWTVETVSSRSLEKVPAIFMD
jgi:hypothetical protein